MIELIIKVIYSITMQDEAEFTISAPAVVPEKPKIVNQKRALHHDSERAPSNCAKHPRALGGGDKNDSFPDQRQTHLAAAGPASRAEVQTDPTSSAPSKHYGEIPHETVLLDNNLNAPEAIPVAAKLQQHLLERATHPPIGKAPPPQQQVAKKWGSFISTDDAW
jgi:hypothetical protein